MNSSPSRMDTQSSERHRNAAAGRAPIAIGILTMSDTRSPDDDVNGSYLRERIEAAGHTVSGYRVIRDDPDAVAGAIDDLGADSRILILNGGTGISSRDNTFDVVSAKIEKELPGFGELFRMLSWDQVGSAAMLSRATAGVYRDTILFSTPGSPAAVRLAWERLIEPELEHLAWEVGR